MNVDFIYWNINMTQICWKQNQNKFSNTRDNDYYISKWHSQQHRWKWKTNLSVESSFNFYSSVELVSICFHFVFILFFFLFYENTVSLSVRIFLFSFTTEHCTNSHNKNVQYRNSRKSRFWLRDRTIDGKNRSEKPRNGILCFFFSFCCEVSRWIYYKAKNTRFFLV